MHSFIYLFIYLCKSFYAYYKKLLFLEQNFMSFSMVNLVSDYLLRKNKKYVLFFQTQFVLDFFIFLKHFQSQYV